MFWKLMASAIVLILSVSAILTGVFMLASGHRVWYPASYCFILIISGICLTFLSAWYMFHINRKWKVKNTRQLSEGMDLLAKWEVPAETWIKYVKLTSGSLRAISDNKTGLIVCAVLGIVLCLAFVAPGDMNDSLYWFVPLMTLGPPGLLLLIFLIVYNLRRIHLLSSGTGTVMIGIQGFSVNDSYQSFSQFSKQLINVSIKTDKEMKLLCFTIETKTNKGSVCHEFSVPFSEENTEKVRLVHEALKRQYSIT